MEQLNRMLREQLDQATAANASLTGDIQRVSHDWQRARDELEQRDADWRREESVFNDYYTNEHARLLQLWRQIIAFRRTFSGFFRLTFLLLCCAVTFSGFFSVTSLLLCCAIR